MHLVFPPDLAGPATSPLLPMPFDLAAWQEHQLRADVPAGGRVEKLASQELKTDTGWPLRLVETRVLSPSGVLLEQRLHAFYTFFDHVAQASLRAPSIEYFNSHIKAWRERLLKGRPDLASDAIVALCQL